MDELGDAAMTGLTIEFCGEERRLLPGNRLTIGRDADLVIDEDNAFLHRTIIELSHEHGFWWIANVGTRLAVTVSGGAGTLQSWVGPGLRVPIVLPTISALFAAGETTYEVTFVIDRPVFETVVEPAPLDDDATLGAVDLTTTQFLLVLSLAEATLRRAGTGTSDLPSNARAAARLGWPITTFNRKLDNVCDKYSRAGVKGLRGGVGQLATHRRARLVEYTVAAKIVRPDHLHLLDEPAKEYV